MFRDIANELWQRGWRKREESVNPWKEKSILF